MRILVFVSLFFIFISSASADNLKYSGVITDLSGNAHNSALYGLAEVGDIIEGFFSYNPAGVTDSNSWDVIGKYYFNETNSSITLIIRDSSNNGAALYEYSGRLSYILTENNWEYAGYPVIDAFSPVGLLDNGSEVFLRYQNRDTNLDLITSDELPKMPLPFKDYNYTTGSITIPNTIGQVDFSITGLEPMNVVPPLFLLLSD
jgi:hypothetical protein